MKKTITALALGAAALMGAGAAHADASEYLDALHGMGFYNATEGDAGLLRSGYRICTQLEAGFTPSEVAARLYRNTDSSVSRADALSVVAVAMADLCGSTSVA